MGVSEGGIPWLGRLWHFVLSEPAAGGRRKFLFELVFGDDLRDEGDGGGVGERRAGGEGRFQSLRDVADGKSQFCCQTGGDGQASAFDGREMLSNSVDRVNRRATSDQGAIYLLNVFQRLPGIEGQLDKGRCAA